LILAYLEAFSLTILVESGAALVILRKKSRFDRIIISALCGNVLSHPLIHFVLPHLISPRQSGLFILVSEIFAFAVETLCYLFIARPSPRIYSVAASAGANLLSYAVGLMIFGGPH
jgi:hypothetical protein